MNAGDSFALALAGRYTDAEASLVGRRDAEARAVRAYLANAAGDFDLVLDLARRALRRAVSPEIKSRMLVTAGSAARQLRRFADAFGYDEAALAAAADPAACAHARIGLGADAVGAGDSAACEEHLRLAAAEAPFGDWRVGVRLEWVRCEHALLTGCPAAGVASARAALEGSRSAGAPRHVAKSSLFLGVALREEGVAAWPAAIEHAESVARRIGAKAIEAVAAAELVQRRGIG